MGQKVHPIGFRLGFTQEHQSLWYASKAWYPLFVLEDRFIRNYLQTHFAAAGLVDMHIARSASPISLSLLVSRPKVIAGTRSEKLADVRNTLIEALKQFRLQNWTKEQRLLAGQPHIILKVLPVKEANARASLLADDLADQLEKRIPFRRAMKSVLQRAERDGVPGIKIQVSGRLNGAEIARTEWIRKGRVPLQTLDAKIDYYARTAKTIYGLLGIKIWVFSGMQDEELGARPSAPSVEDEKAAPSSRVTRRATSAVPAGAPTGSPRSSSLTPSVPVKSPTKPQAPKVTDAKAATEV